MSARKGGQAPRSGQAESRHIYGRPKVFDPERLRIRPLRQLQKAEPRGTGHKIVFPAAFSSRGRQNNTNANNQLHREDRPCDEASAGTGMRAPRRYHGWRSLSTYDLKKRHGLKRTPDCLFALFTLLTETQPHATRPRVVCGKRAQHSREQTQKCFWSKSIRNRQKEPLAQLLEVEFRLPRRSRQIHLGQLKKTCSRRATLVEQTQ